MYLRRDQITRIDRAPAKLNLYLEILGRRADGFHELETLMVPIKLSDSLSLTPTLPQDEGQPGSIQLEVRETYPGRSAERLPMVPTGRENLVVRALELLQARSGCRMGACVRLVKRIPAAAGLGGGSSDAAAALRLANSSWGLDWPIERLSEVAAEVGSDVPFFLSGGAAVCRGRGERVERVHGIRRLSFVVVKPPEDLSTAEVYRAHDALSGGAGGRSSCKIRSFISSSQEGRFQPTKWRRNGLQSAAAATSTWIEKLQCAFDKLDFITHQLSGSGSAYFGVCRHAQHARRLAAVLTTQQLGLVYTTRSCA
jgi:4-diphosphocytidyl-2-C-methyl-D-erythritol kinase